jgi:two-component system cell cycle sensor histidine kinase/response regulator CckA
MSDGGKVTIESSNVEAPRAGSGARGRDAFVALSMTDTGSGMNAETAERLFDPFFTTKEPGRGTGLGLSIVHSIMTDLGGTIHVDSTPGDGATFTVYIPRTALAGLPDVEEPITPEAPQPPTILLVEDQDGVRLLLYRYLVNAGYKVLEARDGEAAIRIANEHESAIDLIVTDMVMPKANGIEVAKAVEEKRPGTQMVFISGYAEELMNGIETLPPGARFLPKPFSEREFLNAVDHLLKRGKNWTMKSSN